MLGADTAALDAALKDAQDSLAKFSANMAKIGAGLGASMAAAGLAIDASLKSALQEADKIGKNGQKIGMPVEELSALNYAAELSNVSTEALTSSLTKLGRAMSEVAGGASNEAAEAFRAMGISVTDATGQLKPTGPVLAELANKISSYKDSAAKTAWSWQCSAAPART